MLEVNDPDVKVFIDDVNVSWLSKGAVDDVVLSFVGSQD